MQLSFQDNEYFFHELSQLVRSGISFQKGLEFLANGRGRVSAIAAKMLQMPREGRAASYFRDFAPLDQALVAAGEENGRMGDIFDQLSEYYAALAKARKLVIFRAIYPLVVLHLGVLLAPIAGAIMEGGWRKYLTVVGVTFGVIYLAFIGLFFGTKMVMGMLRTSVPLDQFIRRIPLLGGVWRNALLSRFCTVLSLTLRSASGFFSGVTRAADASQSAWLKAAVKEAVPQIQFGKGVGEALRASGVLPDDLERAIKVGEESGRLDSEMHRWAEIYRAKLLDSIQALSVWISWTFYVLVAAYTIWQIISMVLSYYSVAQNLINN
jgi:type II secretory pathway component PulF